MSPNRQRNLWRTAFLGGTTLILVGELFAAFDGNPSTDPWTELITTYIPWEVFVAVLGGLIVWIIPHFYVRYRRKALAKAKALAEQEQVNARIDEYSIQSWVETFKNHTEDQLRNVVRNKLTTEHQKAAAIQLLTEREAGNNENKIV